VKDASVKFLKRAKKLLEDGDQGSATSGARTRGLRVRAQWRAFTLAPCVQARSVKLSRRIPSMLWCAPAAGCADGDRCARAQNAKKKAHLTSMLATFRAEQQAWRAVGDAVVSMPRLV
jgi:hypothetical protein